MNSKGNILVVDDTHETLSLLTKLLTDEGYKVFPSDSGELALASLEKIKIDLVLLDVRMPGIDGFEVCRRIKSNPKFTFPIVMLSAATNTKDRVEGLRLGAVDYISKPFEKEELLARVKTHLDLFKLNTILKEQSDEIKLTNDRLFNFNRELEENVKQRTAELQEKNEEYVQINQELYVSKKAVEESERRYKQMFYNNSSICLLINVRTQQIIDANQSACNFYKYSHNEMIRLNLYQINTRTVDELAGDIENVVKDKQKYFIFKHRKADGEICDVEVYTGQIILYDEIVLFSVIHDISERVKIEQALKESEENYRLLFDNMTNGFQLNEVIYDEKNNPVDFRILDANKYFNDFSGLDYKKVKGKTFKEVFPAANPELIRKFALVGVTGEPNQYEYYSNAFNKYIKFLSYSPKKNQFACVYENITERKIADEKLKKSQVLLHSSIESHKDTIMLSIDKNYCYLYFNNAHALDMKAAYNIDVKLGMNIFDCISSDKDRIAVKENYARALAGESHSNIRKYGDFHVAYYESFFNPIINDKNEIIGATVLARDITERIEVLEKLKASETKLKELNADKDRFISILAHDLKNPFNSILGFLDLLSANIRNYSIDKIERQVNIISSSTKHIYRLLEDILVWARAQSGKIPFNPQKLIFEDIYKEVMQDQKLAAENKNITIKYFEAEEISIYVDKNMIKTVLRNLLSNAIKFTHKNGQINVYAVYERNNIVISVSDTGVGIELESVSKLFNISRVRTTDGTDNEKGTGLGLLLCKEFIEKHGGKIWVESKPEQGSDFKFILPKV